MARVVWLRLPSVDLARVSLVELINWTYLSQEVDLGNANDHGKSALRSA